jgi:hypothetical protein
MESAPIGNGVFHSTGGFLLWDWTNDRSLDDDIIHESFYLFLLQITEKGLLGSSTDIPVIDWAVQGKNRLERTAPCRV